MPVIGGERIQEHIGGGMATPGSPKVRHGNTGCLLADKCKVTPFRLSADPKTLRAGASDNVLERPAYMHRL